MLVEILVGAIALLLIGVPLGLALMGATLAVLLLTEPSQATTVPLVLFQSINNANLVALPLLVIAGQVMAQSGLMEPLLSLAARSVRRLPGGLSLACVLIAVFFGGATGSSAGESATLAMILQDPFRRRGYAANFTGALIAASAAIGPLFPPALALVVYSSIVENSATVMWKAAIAPGVLATVLIAATAVWTGAKYERRATTAVGHESEEGPSRPDKLSDGDSEVQAEAVEAGEIKRSRHSGVAEIVIVTALPVLVVASLYSGILTVSETAASLAGYVIVYSLVFRRSSIKGLWRSLERGGERAGIVLLLYLGAQVLSHYVVNAGLEQDLLDGIRGSGLPHWALLALLIVLLLACGSMMDGLSLLVIAAPILAPLVTKFGIGEVQFGIILVMVIEISVVHPPVGMNLFAVSSVTNLSVGSMVRPILPFIGCLLLTLAAVAFIPLPIFSW